MTQGQKKRSEVLLPRATMRKHPHTHPINTQFTQHNTQHNKTHAHTQHNTTPTHTHTHNTAHNTHLDVVVAGLPLVELDVEVDDFLLLVSHLAQRLSVVLLQRPVRLPKALQRRPHLRHLGVRLPLAVAAGQHGAQALVQALARKPDPASLAAAKPLGGVMRRTGWLPQKMLSTKNPCRESLSRQPQTNRTRHGITTKSAHFPPSPIPP